MAARRRRPAERFTVEELVALLLPTLGGEKSTELVESTKRQLGFSLDDLDEAGAIAIFQALSVQEGLVGVAARFIKMRLQQEAKRVSSFPVPVERLANSARQPKIQLAETWITRPELVEKFASALGSEKSLAIIDAAANVVGAQGDRLSPAKALEIVEHLADSEGLVGIVARFAKAQILLRVQKPPG